MGLVLTITKPVGVGEPLHITFDVAGTVTADTLAEMMDISAVEVALSAADGRRTSFESANTPLPNNFATWSAKLRTPSVSLNVLEVRLRDKAGAIVATTQKGLNFLANIHWTAPCGCEMNMEYDEKRGSSADLWVDKHDPLKVRGNVAVREEPNAIYISRNCPDHSSVALDKQFHCCWREAKLVGSALRHIEETVPAATETVTGPAGPQKRYKDGLLPLEVAWSGKDESRIPTFKVSAGFRGRGFIKKADMDAMQAKLDAEFGAGKAAVDSQNL